MQTTPIFFNSMSNAVWSNTEIIDKDLKDKLSKLKYSMEYDEQKHSIALSSGRTFYAFGGIGLLSPQSGGELIYGHDGCCTFGDTPLTSDERKEIADKMRSLWNQWGLGGILDLND